MRKTYAGERYEELYEKELGEREYEEAVRARGVKCYRAKVTEAGRVMNINLGAVWSTKKEAGRAAKAKRGRSEEAQRRAHYRRDEEAFTAIANLNFGEGDKAITLTFRDGEHPDAAKAWRVFLQTVRREEKKRGAKEVVALHMIEETSKDGEPLRQHIHAMLKTELSRDELEAIWFKRYGFANASLLRPDENGLCGYAAYLLKAGPSVKKKRRWGCTRNCKRPEPKRTTRLPNGKRLTKKLVYELVSGAVDAKDLFERAYPGWRLIAFTARGSEYVSGVWIDLRMTKTGGDGFDLDGTESVRGLQADGAGAGGAPRGR